MQKESFAKEFRSLHVDLDKNIYEINGKVVSPKCFYLKLESGLCRPVQMNFIPAKTTNKLNEFG